MRLVQGQLKTFDQFNFHPLIGFRGFSRHPSSFFFIILTSASLFLYMSLPLWVLYSSGLSLPLNLEQSGARPVSRAVWCLFCQLLCSPWIEVLLLYNFLDANKILTVTLPSTHTIHVIFPLYFVYLRKQVDTLFCHPYNIHNQSKEISNILFDCIIKVHKNAACCELSWTGPGDSTPQDTNCTATCLLSRKLFKLDEPDMQDTAGEAEMNS